MAELWVSKEVSSRWPAAQAYIPRHRVGTATRPHPGRMQAGDGSARGFTQGPEHRPTPVPISLGPRVQGTGSGREGERAVTQEREMIETFLLQRCGKGGTPRVSAAINQGH